MVDSSTALAENLATEAGDRPARDGRRLPVNWLGAMPFLGYVALFLILPTGIIAIEAFTDGQGRFTMANLDELSQDYILTSFENSMLISGVTSVVGAVLGALLAYAIVSGKRDGMLRRIATSASGVLAQFGGIMLAFAFIVTVGSEGLVTVFIKDVGGPDVSGLWLFDIPGILLVYAYFQIPLMVLVFLPALDGIRPQWREATESLGGSTWDYWRHVAFPILTPPFLGALLLLFANAFSAYATAAALVSQGGIIIPLQIQSALSSEVILGRENVGKALALGMIVIVAIVMTANAWLQKRSSRWLR